jgi:hypothetical protein
MDDQYLYVFNQYYIDLLKKIKNYAKETDNGKDISKSIKSNYQSMDKMSNEYIKVLDETSFWDHYNALEEPWNVDAFPNFELYKDIKFGDICKIFKEKYTLHYYMIIFNIFRNKDIVIDDVMNILKEVSSKDFEDKLKDIGNDNVVSNLKKLNKIHSSQTNNIFDNELKELEGTSLGKLAKDIMGDINIHEIQESLSGGDNIMETLQNPDNNISKMISSVSTKMLSKIASGELKQENLLNDAMMLATKLPNMIPGGMGGLGGLGGLGDLGKMFSQFQNMGINPDKAMNEMGSKKNKGKVKSQIDRTKRRNQISQRLRDKINKKMSSEEK